MINLFKKANLLLRLATALTLAQPCATRASLVRKLGSSALQISHNRTFSVHSNVKLQELKDQKEPAHVKSN